MSIRHEFTTERKVKFYDGQKNICTCTQASGRTTVARPGRMQDVVEYCESEDVPFWLLKMVYTKSDEYG